MGTAFKELEGSPEETFGAGSTGARRRLIVAYENRLAMVSELLGDGYAFGGTQRAGFPGRTSLVATRVSAKPFTDQSPDHQGSFTDITANLNSYAGKYAELSVDYELLQGMGLPNPESLEENTFLTYRMDFGGEYVKLPGRAMQWVEHPEQPVPEDAMPLLRCSLIEHHITWHRVINPPWEAISAAAGTVNSALLCGIDAGFLEFDGCTADKEFVALDNLNYPQFGWKMNYVFVEKRQHVLGGSAVGWNWTYRSLPVASPDWDRLVDGSGNGLYVAYDHNNLFQFAAST